MFQSDFENNPNRHSERRVGKPVVVVGDPAETQPATSRMDGQWQHGVDEDNKWVSDRLTACYND